MKQHNNKIPLFLITITVLLSLSLNVAIWQYGPLLNISGNLPLLATQARVIAILICLTLTVGVCASIQLKARQWAAQHDFNDDNNFETEGLRQRFLGAIQFLKTTDTTQKDGSSAKLFDLPWFLMLGTLDAGKSSLLANSGLNFILAKKSNTVFPLNKTEYCDWWATKEAVFIDASGSFVIQHKRKPRQRKLWLAFLELLKSQRKQSLNGLILTVSVERLALQSKEEQRATFISLRKRILDVQKHLQGEFPLYVVFTKCDYLAGFSEFFEHLNQEERQQLWGINFAKLANSQQRVLDTFDSEFDELLKRLNERLISVMHHEITPKRRELIKDFPLQMESIKKPIAYFLQHIADITTLNSPSKLRGIYFTSAFPQGQTIDRLLNPLSNSFELQLYNPKQEPRIPKAFFTMGLFRDLIFLEAQRLQLLQETPAKTTDKWLQPLTLSAAGLLVIATGAYWTHNFSTSFLQVNQAESAMAHYDVLVQQPQKHLDESQALDAINALGLAASNLQNNNFQRITPFAHRHQERIAKSAELAYLNAIQSIVSLAVQQNIHEQLHDSKHIDGASLYSALEAYLMLGSPQQLDQSVVSHWVQQHWAEQINSDEKRQQLQSHLDYLFAHQPQPIKLNPALIQQARKALTHLPPEQLTMTVLENDFALEHPPLSLSIPSGNAYGKIFKAKDNTLSIPAIYTKTNFAKVYNELLPAAVQEAVTGNWVLGNTTHKKTVDDAWFRQLRDHYMKAYTAAWQATLEPLDMVNIANLEQAIQVIDALSAESSPLLTILNAIDNNTHLSYDNLPTPVSIKFARFHKTMADINSKSSNSLHGNLLQLKTILLNITTDSEPNKMAFNTAKIRMVIKGKDDAFDALLKAAYNAPQPIKGWLANITENSWRYILKDANHYISQQWASTVVPAYNNDISGHYPMDKQALTDTSLAAFNQFFSPNGVLNSFFANYLFPFIDTKQGKWTWQKVDGLAIGFNDDIITTLHQAAIIQSVFFPDNSVQVNVAFSVSAKELDNNLAEFSLDIDKQHGSFKPASNKPANFQWPDDSAMHSATIAYTDNNHDTNKQTEAGPWAWLRVLDKATITTTNSPKQLNVAFDLNGFSTATTITSKTDLNPFTPNLLQDFSLPEKLG